MRLKERTLFYRTPGRGVLARSHSYYTRRRGGQKLRMDTTTTCDDNIHSLQRAFSSDHGLTWSEPEQLKVKEPAH